MYVDLGSWGDGTVHETCEETANVEHGFVIPKIGESHNPEAEDESRGYPYQSDLSTKILHWHTYC